MGCSSSVHTRVEEERGGSSLRRAEDDNERQGFRKAKAKKRFSVVDFVKNNVRDKRQAEDESYAGLDADMKENRKPAESSAEKRFSVEEFAKDNLMRQAESSSSETTSRCTFCGDNPEKKLTCVLCGDAPHHARGRKRSISLDGDAFTPIRSRASHRRSISEDARCLGAASGTGGAPASRMSCVGCKVSALPRRAGGARRPRVRHACEARALLVSALVSLAPGGGL
jgi:hypothetical protein